MLEVSAYQVLISNPLNNELRGCDLNKITDTLFNSQFKVCTKTEMNGKNL